ncbi:MAG: M48 family metalloprotease, partial [Planctomycetales bacterium]|nr:M48 family metalloprotease [Planctomycetales bacterium]
MSMLIVVALAALSSLALAPGDQVEPLGNGAMRTAIVGLAVALLSLLPVGFSLPTAHRLILRSPSACQGLRQFRRWQTIHTWLWLAVSVAIVIGLDWPTYVRINLGLGTLPVAAESLILAPLLLPLTLAWAAYYDVDRAAQQLQNADTSLDTGHSSISRLQYVMVQARLYFGMSIGPLLFLFLSLDVAHLLRPTWNANELAGWVIAAMLMLLLATYPLLLRALWRSPKLPAGPLRWSLEHLTARSGLKLGEILVWPTDGRVCNAAVAGVTPLCRYVFLTDGLLRSVPAEEVEAAFAHELAHIARHHLWWRLLGMCVPIAWWGTLQPWYSHHPIACLVGSLLIVTLGGIAFGWYAKLLEYDADLWAVRQLGSVRGGVRAAQARYARMLETMDPASSRSRWEWLHPHTAHRIAFLQRTVNPQSER